MNFYDIKSDNDEEQSAKLKALQHGCVFFSLKNSSVNLNSIHTFSPEQAKEHMAIPLFRSEKKLFVAMKNPEDSNTISQLSAVSGLEVSPCIIPDNEFDYLLNNCDQMIIERRKIDK